MGGRTKLYTAKQPMNNIVSHLYYLNQTARCFVGPCWLQRRYTYTVLDPGSLLDLAGSEMSSHVPSCPTCIKRRIMRNAGWNKSGIQLIFNLFALLQWARFTPWALHKSSYFWHILSILCLFKLLITSTVAGRIAVVALIRCRRVLVECWHNILFYF